MAMVPVGCRPGLLVARTPRVISGRPKRSSFPLALTSSLAVALGRRVARAAKFVPADGVELEVLGGPSESESRVSLVCIHGSYHAAWCYAKYLDFFRESGINAYALSLRGQGDGEMAFKPVAGTLEEHASDVSAFVNQLKSEGQEVVLLGHSFGGLITLQAAAAVQLAGLVLLCSVPPSGNVGIILRSLFRSPLQALRITWGFITRAFERDELLCREIFFDTDTPLPEVQEHMARMKRGCPSGSRLLDLRQLQKSLPVPICKAPVLVLGGSRDAVVDAEAIKETAEAHGVEPQILEGVPHDAMLSRWECSARAILEWLRTEPWKN